MEIFDGGTELEVVGTRANEHAEVQHSIGVGDVGEVRYVFGDVTLYGSFAFFSDR